MTKLLEFPKGTHIKVETVNATEGHRLEPCTSEVLEFCTKGELFSDLQQSFGRCTGRVFVDSSEGAAWVIQVGWVFVKRVQYSDCDDTYLQETWVTVLRPVEYHAFPFEDKPKSFGYQEIGRA